MPTNDALTELTKTLNEIQIGLSIPLEGLVTALVTLGTEIRKTTDQSILNITDEATAKLYRAVVMDWLTLREKINTAIGWPV